MYPKEKQVLEGKRGIGFGMISRKGFRVLSPALRWMLRHLQQKEAGKITGFDTKQTLEINSFLSFFFIGVTEMNT